MRIALLTAVGVGGATIVGSAVGFLVRRVPKGFSDLALGFAGGVMLSASVWGLMIPSMGEGSLKETAVTALGVACGAVFIGLCQNLVPKLRFVAGEGFENGEADRVLGLVLAMAVHNFPEGVAAGVSLGSGDLGGALAVAGGIALQNIPEGMAVIPPMLAAGISRKRVVALALATGASEVAGTVFGYRAVMTFAPILPFSLAFAGGAMLFVIADGTSPNNEGEGKKETYAFCLGFCIMLFAGCLL